jgi:hypothetical protein
MQPLTDQEAHERMVSAQRKVPHSDTTIEQYGAWVRRYRAARKQRICCNLQSYLDYLASDPAARVNPKTVHQALNALKFYHENDALISPLDLPPIQQIGNLVPFSASRTA